MNSSAASFAASTTIPVERRFPLDLRRAIPSIRELYETAKAARWTPATAVDWERLDAASYSHAERDAARRVWSRRAWVEYTGISETPALLIRFCVEHDRESDPKYFLTVRNTEEAWHVESFHRLAGALGGYQPAPEDRAWEAVLNRNLYRTALDATESLDAYVAVHCALEDGLELALYESYLANARDPVVKRLLELVVADKARHAAFGWLYLEDRLPKVSAESKVAIGVQAQRWVHDVAFAGYTIPSLATAIDSAREREAAEITSQAGLGAVPAATEEKIFIDVLAETRDRFRQLGISLPLAIHPRLGPL